MKLEVFFDYACPFCMRGHEYLKELISESSPEIIWRPCEAHPRPEHYGPHSDLCIQGMFFALDRGVDIWAYHDLMYKAALKARIDIENSETLAEYAGGLLPGLSEALRSGKYIPALNAANEYAYELSGVWAVPSYRMGGRKLDAVENIGVTKQQLAEFIKDKNRLESSRGLSIS